ncbi:uncharacterized protein NDAI_0E01740 [Naumovozyma dairenensis CBS 421]|uniref:Uncharacterized protein n=1 Tax=Naumovozyma dairenensis (strain ATCC 10597 / BCRC 20456 / CBS 421 / NBRC 0211 / NRRL Y-12639) TaxID=1071378 RepID=G0WB70_NAUDC|nr:hypothetical protein NDAI_0E01740 [Naumovozyma dairenensis CBS 421]CCD24990.1 hypothetical protein NDAI_0E01740 [Naumovozyma dairenensis CBS 421]
MTGLQTNEACSTVGTFTEVIISGTDDTKQLHDTPVNVKGSISHHAQAKPGIENQVLSADEASATIVHLNKQLGRLQQLLNQKKLRNMLLENNAKSLKSNNEVERKLHKEQFDQMKYQSYLEKEKLLRNLRLKDMKIRKYKKRIISKNKEINRLTKILNDNSVKDNLRNLSPSVDRKESISSNSEIYSSQYTGSTPTNKLRTLGVLATRVLNEESEGCSDAHTILEESDPSPVDPNATELE